jgi:hypothetical protein
MNVFLTENPKVVILVDKDGQPIVKATNISPNVEVVVTDREAFFLEQCRNLPFNLH